MRSTLNPSAAITMIAGVIAWATAVSADEMMTTNAVAVGPAPLGLPAEHGGLGVGVILGEPTGFGAKYWFSSKTAMDLGAAWSFEDRDSFQLHGDFLMHRFDLFRVDRGELPLYFGVGGRVKLVEHGDDRVGVRLPVGVAYLFPDAPVELFAEVAPIVDVAPSTTLKFNGGVGVRYYFR